jgi:Protein of unknown function (DUF3626)
MTSLLDYQSKALEYITESASQRRAEAINIINKTMAREGISINEYIEAMKSLYINARIDIHFHPERLSLNGKSVAEGILSEGIFRNQYDTGLSSGSTTAFPGGERDLWEQRLFGGAYHTEIASFSNRPKYGALEIMSHPDGASPRFGSCYFVLHQVVSKRSSYTFGGSQEEDALDRTGTLSDMEPVMAALFNEIEQGNGTLGIDDLSISTLLEQLIHGIIKPFCDLSTRPLGKSLDSFVEAQIHGSVRIDEDVESLIADPSFRNGPVGEVLDSISTKYRVPLFWHPGFILPVKNIPEHFRGFAVRSLAQRIAGQGILDAAIIGIAENSVKLEPESWKDWEAGADIFTQFRRLWHVMVLYGKPRNSLIIE